MNNIRARTPASEMELGMRTLLPASTETSDNGSSRGNIESISRSSSGSSSHVLSPFRSLREENNELTRMEDELEERKRKLDQWEEDLNKRRCELEFQERELARREREVMEQDEEFERLKDARGPVPPELALDDLQVLGFSLTPATSSSSAMLTILQARVEALESKWELHGHQRTYASESQNAQAGDGKPLPPAGISKLFADPVAG